MISRFQNYRGLFPLALLCCLAACTACDDKRGATGDAASVAPLGSAITLPGVETDRLSTRERLEWSGIVSEVMAPCSNVPVTLVQCVKESRPCKKCLPAAKAIAKAIHAGMPREQVLSFYKNRYEPAGVQDVPIDGSPVKGPATAPITVVEFADFQCGACAAFSPILDQLLADRPGQVRLVYKVVALPSHEYAENAARAALAAGNQGKFWEMHKKLFANQRDLKLPQLEDYAETLGLNMSKFREDMKSAPVSSQFERDKKLMERLKLHATPSLFINGREFVPGGNPLEELRSWVDEELGENPVPAPGVVSAAASSAVPAPSAAPSSSARPRASEPKR